MTPPSPAVQPPRVFISYAYDSVEHEREVGRLAELLVENDVDVRIDRWVDHSPLNWGEWTEREIQHADFVLVIASPEYRKAALGGPDPVSHRGARAEAAVIRDLMYGEAERWSRRVLAVVLPAREVAEIPAFLQPYTRTHYRIRELTAEGAGNLLRALTARSLRRSPEPGREPAAAGEVIDGVRPPSAAGRAAAEAADKVSLGPDRSTGPIPGLDGARPADDGWPARRQWWLMATAVILLVAVVAVGPLARAAYRDRQDRADERVVTMQGGDRVDLVAAMTGFKLLGSDLALSGRRSEANQFILSVVGKAKMARADPAPEAAADCSAVLDRRRDDTLIFGNDSALLAVPQGWICVSTDSGQVVGVHVRVADWGLPGSLELRIRTWPS